MLNGVKRGLFSNEAGMGSAPNTAATDVGRGDVFVCRVAGNFADDHSIDHLETGESSSGGY